MRIFARLSLLLFLCAVGAAHALDKVAFLTNWYAEAEHGGFYQAVAEGIYEKYGLDVKIGMGGPQVNVYQLLLAEKVDFVMGYDVATINAVEQNLPLITVAANFQSEPVGLIAHPDVDRIEDLKTRTLLIGQASETTYWPWLKAKYGFTEASALGWKSYLKNPAPGNALIKKDNPQMDDDQIAFSIAKLKEYGIVDSGDAKKRGLFTMTDVRWKQTFAFMRDAGLVKPDVDYHKAYTLEFVKQVKVLP